MDEQQVLRLINSSKNILLVEAVPGKYPPLGLMKLAGYCRYRGKFFSVVRGRYRLQDPTAFDLVLISLGEFSYCHDEVVKTLAYYDQAFDQ